MSHVNAQNVFPAIHPSTYGDIDNLLYNVSCVADMVMDCIQTHNGIDIIQGVFLLLFTIGSILSVMWLLVFQEIF